MPLLRRRNPRAGLPPPGSPAQHPRGSPRPASLPSPPASLGHLAGGRCQGTRPCLGQEESQRARLELHVSGSPFPVAAPDARIKPRLGVCGVVCGSPLWGSAWHPPAEAPAGLCAARPSGSSGSHLCFRRGSDRLLGAPRPARSCCAVAVETEEAGALGVHLGPGPGAMFDFPSFRPARGARGRVHINQPPLETVWAVPGASALTRAPILCSPQPRL